MNMLVFSISYRSDHNLDFATFHVQIRFVFAEQFTYSGKICEADTFWDSSAIPYF